MSKTKDINIGFWNVKWLQKNEDKSSNRIENNQSRARVAQNILYKDFDILALAEAGNEKSLEIEGYNKKYLNRYRNDFHFRNGILLYGKVELNLKVNTAVQEELKKEKIDCFLPVIGTIKGKTIHFLFVWTATKENENGDRVAYGYNRFNEILNLKVTKDFIDGHKHNVIMIGDFNINSNPLGSDYEKKLMNWINIKNKLGHNGLQWIENDEATFSDTVINDHCFVSENIFDTGIKLTVNNRIYGNVDSDHNLICLTIEI